MSSHHGGLRGRSHQLFVPLGFFGTTKQGKYDCDFTPDFAVVGVHLISLGIRHQSIPILALLKGQVALTQLSQLGQSREGK